RIIDAARELFAGEQADVQMDDIARHARVGVGTVYRHFPDKEALMGELVRQRLICSTRTYATRWPTSAPARSPRSPQPYAQTSPPSRRTPRHALRSRAAASGSSPTQPSRSRSS